MHIYGYTVQCSGVVHLHLLIKARSTSTKSPARVRNQYFGSDCRRLWAELSDFRCQNFPKDWELRSSLISDLGPEFCATWDKHGTFGGLYSLRVYTRISSRTTHNACAANPTIQLKTTKPSPAKSNQSILFMLLHLFLLWLSITMKFIIGIQCFNPAIFFLVFHLFICLSLSRSQTQQPYTTISQLSQCV